MITDDQKQCYLAVKKLNALLEKKDRSEWRMLSRLFETIL